MLKDYIINKSRELNIDLIGFTDGKPLLDLKDYLEYRKENNIATEFEEGDLQKRIDPRLSLETCKSIIVIGMSYNVPSIKGDIPRPRGIISRSSWGLDYHRVLRARLESLAGEISKEIDFEYKAYVDTGPLLDRELAKKAAIGYYGKNCSIISKDYGSFIFLGYMLTNLDLEAETSLLEEDCGDCDLCIKACPTGALEGPYRLNPKKCISYLSQTKDTISEDLRHKMGIKIYGCDTCQLVCPKNKGVKISSHKEFMGEDSISYMDIGELLHMSNRGFKNKYGSMAGAWRGKNILIRNSIIALGNMKNIGYLHLLEDFKKRTSSWDEYIEWAIEKILINN